jgi:hypothetical protein
MPLFSRAWSMMLPAERPSASKWDMTKTLSSSEIDDKYFAMLSALS